jgi:UDP-N-acetylmuramoyl-tripeptide--D-alanyl-D-alanine ligase
VHNTLEAYQKIAQWWRKQFSIPVIAITGSVGKTTTKELIAAVLSTQGQVHKTAANYNNEIGVPKTLLDLSDTHNYAVIEMAMRARGEIAQLTAMTSPTIGVITNVGTAHIGRLGGEDAIAEAKCELLATMPQDSIAILNHDNQRLINKAKTLWKGETLTYGLESGDIQGRLLASDLMEVEGNRFSLPLPGRHNALNYLGALAVAKILGIDGQTLSSGISVNLPGGRAQCYQLAADILLLDETYNAGLESMLAALDLLKSTPGTRHIAVLGAMKELGEYSAQFHFQVGERVKQLGLDGLFVLVDDPASEAILVGAGKGEGLKTHGELMAKLKAEIRPGDRLLFKASHSVGLGRVVAALAQTLTI